MDELLAQIQMTTIVEFAFKLISLRGEDMWQNHCLVDEFVWFMITLPDKVKVNIVRSTSDAFNFIHQQVEKKPKYQNPMVFLCQFLFLQLKRHVSFSWINRAK